MARRVLVTAKMAGRGKGVEAVLHAFKKTYERTVKGVDQGLENAAYFLLAKSREIVPIDTSALHDTSRVTKRGRGYMKEYLVEYRMFYAIFVHEDLQARHAPGKTAKFLEGPSRRYSSHMAKIVRLSAEKKRGV